jgi:hypothetical protein
MRQARVHTPLLEHTCRREPGGESNQSLHLTGAARLVFREFRLPLAAPAGEGTKDRVAPDGFPPCRNFGGRISDTTDYGRME